MVWQYTEQDKALVDSVRFELQGGAPGSDGSNNGGKIEFQFPPKIVSDSRKGDWKEVDKPGSEPTFEYKKSGAREISMNWTYVIDSFDTNNARAWTIPRITRNIRTLRGYFAQTRNPGSDHENLVIIFSMWSMGGSGSNQDHMTALIKNVDVKYGESIVVPPGQGTDQAFFLRSDISVDLRLWTQGVGEGGGDVLQKIDSIMETLDPTWY